MADQKTPNTTDVKKTSKKTPTTKKTRASSSAKKTTSQPVAASQKTQSAKPQQQKPAQDVKQTVAPAAMPTATKAAQESPKKSGSGLSIFALLLSLLALAASGYLVYEAKIQRAENNTNMAVGLTEIQGNIGRIGDVMSTLQQNIQTVQQQQTAFVNTEAVAQQLQQTINPLQARQDALSKELGAVRQQVSGDDSQYVISRIARLLEMASIEINLGKNSASAIQALSLAAAQIKASNNASLEFVRTQLLADIDALQSVEKPDLAAISTKISAIHADIEAWPLQNEPNAELIKRDAPETEATESDSLIGEFKRLASQMVTQAIRVQKVDAAPKPLLVPEQRYFLNQNLRLQLLTAQNAALQGEQTVYRENLRAAQKWINDYFDLRDQRVQSALQAIEAIAQTELQPKLHDISATLKSFNDVTANPDKG